MATVAPPMQPVDAQGSANKGSAPVNSTVAPNDVHILLVDDERMSRVVVGNLLRKCGYKVTEAGSGMEALEVLRRHPAKAFSLILTDVMMPDVDGIELLRHVRGEEQWSDLPVIMMSANERTETVFECIRGGAEDYLLKPVTRKEVQHMWQHVWRRQQQSALRVPHFCAEEAEEFLRAHSTTASVPTPPLALVHESAAALASTLDSPSCAPAAAQPQPALPQQQPGDSQSGTSHMPDGEEAERERQQSGAQAGSSGRGGATPGGQQGGLADARTGAAAVPGREEPPQAAAAGARSGARPGSRPGAEAATLAAYFARRGSVVRMGDAFRIFCGILSLLKMLHARDVTLRRVRPSMLRITSSGVLVSPGAAADEEEESFYASPEELLSAGAAATPRSDVYSLGVLFFELFNPVADAVVRRRALRNLRHRILPLSLLQTRPQEAAFVLSLLNPDPEGRPTVDTIVRSELLLELHRSIRQRKQAHAGAGQISSQAAQQEVAQQEVAQQAAAAGAAKAAAEGRAARAQEAAAQVAADRADQEVLLDFLRLMKQCKESEGQNTVGELDALETDIQTVTQRLARVTNSGVPLLPAGLRRAMLAPEAPAQQQQQQQGAEAGGSGGSGSRKRPRTEHAAPDAAVNGDAPGSAPKSHTAPSARALEASWARVSEAFPALESAFFRRRSAGVGGRPGQAPSSSHRAAAAGASAVPPSPAVFPSSELGFLLEDYGQPGGVLGAEPADHLSAFSGDLSRFLRYSKLKVRATLQAGDPVRASDMLCSISFDRDDEFFATAGVSRRIKVYATSDVLEASSAIHCPRLEMAGRSKLSCVVWNSYMKNVLLAADYEGTLALWDAEAAHCTATYEEHAKRVWSADFSQTDPTRFVSGSDDGTVRLWSVREEAPVAAIDAKANVCSVQLSPLSSHLLAFGSANYRVYLYDLRHMKVPLAVIGGHSKAVSYVRWMGGNALVSASTDGALKVWDVAAGVTAADAGHHAWRPTATLTGHVNERNFVGLSVSADNYIACGSEDNSVVAYYAALPTPLARHCFSGAQDGCKDSSECEDAQSGGHQFVSSVCWSRKGHTLLAANSQGTLKLLELN